MENNEKLKLCPFCGGKAVFKTNSNESSHHGVAFNFEIECESCKVKLPMSYSVGFFLTENGSINPVHDERKQAVEDWNRRIK